MNKIAKGILRTLLLIAIVMVVLIVGLVLFLGPIIKTGAEQFGPKVLGVPVTVENVSVNVLAGSVGLKNLRVGNPAGYSSDPMFALGELRLGVDLASLPGKDPIQVREVAIINPRISYETANGISNVDALKAKLRKPGSPEPEKQPEAKPAASQPAPRKVVIKRFECRGGVVSVRTRLTLGKAIALPLPPVVATNIGAKSGGATVAEATGEMLDELAGGVTSAVGDAGKAVVSAGGDTVKAVSAVGTNALGKLKSLF